MTVAVLGPLLLPACENTGPSEELAALNDRVAPHVSVDTPPYP